MYEVIRDFTDLQDNEYPYNVGDLFPHDGLEVSEERIKELSSSKNLQKRPLIKRVEEKRYTKTDINKMKTADLQILGSEVGIENAFETSGEKLKELLIEHFGL